MRCATAFPGLLRAGLLVAFHLYVWAAFWHQSGGVRLDADDALLRRVDLALAPAARGREGGGRRPALERRLSSRRRQPLALANTCTQG